MATRTCDGKTSSTSRALSPALKELLQALIEAPESDCNVLGERLCRAPRTVRKEMEMLYERLGVGGKNARAAALVRALQIGWITLPAQPNFPMRGGKILPKAVNNKAHALLLHGMGLVILPSTKQFNGGDWRRQRRFFAQGAVNFALQGSTTSTPRSRRHRFFRPV